jgi:hypothetical protein
VISTTDTREEPDMTAVVTRITTLRELAHRSSNGVDVTMLWDPATDRVHVAVIDSEVGEAFNVPVRDANPMDVFNHPYFYAGLEQAAA